MNTSISHRNPLRIAILTNAVPGYRVPVFRGLAADDALDLKIFISLPAETSDSSARESLDLCHSRGMNLRRRTIYHQAATEYTEWLHIPAFLFFDLWRYKPGLVISGEFGLRSLVAYMYTAIHRVPLILWSEEIKERAAGVSGLQRWLRKFLIPRANGFLAWGRPATQYLRSWHVPDDKIYYCAQAVDNEYWQARAKSRNKNTIRAELGLQGKVFLAVGRLITCKGIDKLLLSWHALPAVLKEKGTVVIVGSGPEEPMLRELVRVKKIPNIVFAGAQSPEQVASYYAAADVFVFPSLLDVWGLVVNEAMAFGLPVLASKYAGASQELVRDTGAGELFDPNDLEEFTNLLRRWCTQSISVEPDRIRRIAEKLNFDVSIAAIKRVIMDQ